MKTAKHIFIGAARAAAVSLAALTLLCCTPKKTATIPIITWAGVSPQMSAEVFPLLKECGMDGHLGLYGDAETALRALDVAQQSGLWIIPGFPEIKDSTEVAVRLLQDHPALYGWHLKDEPETWDFAWLKALAAKVDSLDGGKHPCYINLYPDWAWGGELYENHIKAFASEVNVPFYSFDQYPITENEDGSVSLRPGWYRNLEVFSAMARSNGKPFWAFALTTSHHLGAPSPEAFYPVPTLGHLRLQVFSDLLYGAQAIQYFTADGLYDSKSHCPTGVYALVKQVNSEIKAYSPVFLGCTVEKVRHSGESIPMGTTALDLDELEGVKKLEISGDGALVSLISNGERKYLAIQNRDCTNPAMLSVGFEGKVKRLIPSSDKGLEKVTFDNKSFKLEEGNVAIFQIR